MILQERIKNLNTIALQPGPLIYWMSRDQRVHNNWALLYAQQLAFERKVPFAVVFTLVPQFLDATIRQYDFMVRGLQEIDKTLSHYGIPFILLIGSPPRSLHKFIHENSIGGVVADFSPLRIHRSWKSALVKSEKIPIYEVDAHNIVPCWEASQKLEYGAYTLRPKIHRVLNRFMDDFPSLKKHPYPWTKRVVSIDFKKAYQSFRVDRSVPPVGWLAPGERAAQNVMKIFIKERLGRFHSHRNDPTMNYQSDLSPYLHFGHISAQRIALEVRKMRNASESSDAFLEELIIRKELSDNYCFYNDHYDSMKGFPVWAQKTLAIHQSDKREYLYTAEQFEHARTHDPLWNAAQHEMVHTGKMHGYMRMYWAKKILEWTRTTEEALWTAIYLNDTYELDGRDPNGYAGIAWSIGGVHDRAWGERPIFGKIRYMSADGCKRKFDVATYCKNQSLQQ